MMSTLPQHIKATVRIDCCNIQGLRSNFAEVKVHIENNLPSLLFLTETQVSRASPDLAAPKDYRFLSSFEKKHGICVYVHPSLSYARAVKYEVNNRHFNSIVLRLRVSNHYIFVIGLYRSPNTPSSVDCFEELGDALCQLFEDLPEAQLVIVGDFNVHNSNWLQHSSHTDVPGRRAEFLAHTFCLQQLVDEPTRIPASNQAANTLDLVLTSIPQHSAVTVSPPLGSSDHCMVSLTLDIAPELTYPPPPRSVYNYAKAQWDKLNDFFLVYPWRLVTSANSVNNMVDSLTDGIKLGMKLYIPLIHLGQNTKKHVPTVIKNALREKQDAYKKYNKIRVNSHRDSLALSQARDELRQITNRCKSIIKTEDFKFIKGKTDKVLDHPNDPRFYFHTVRSLQNNFAKPTTPPLNNNGITISDPREKCNHLASIFATNSTISEPPFAPHPLPQISTSMNPIIFRKNIVRKHLLELNTHKAVGPDGIPALILKRFAHIFAPILTRIFAVSHQSGCFPDSWKIVNVQPIPKKGDKADATNYRPIAIISVLSKVYENYIHQYVLKHVEKSSILCDRQYGFRKGRSTCDALTMLLRDWNRTLEQESEVYAISLDISKAFDSVWHANLISKLKSYGFYDAMITLLGSYLYKRKIRVVLDGYSSDLFELNAGVPQGSPLASTLFLLYINDLLSTTFNFLHSYADDTTLHARLHSMDSKRRDQLDHNRKSVTDSLTADLQVITSWGKKNLMKFNASKTQLCVISRKKSECCSPILMNDIPLIKQETVHLLGVTTSDSLLWNDHLNNIAKSTAQKLGFLARCRKFFTSEQSLKIYKSMIRPCLEYCSPVWGGACETQLSILDAVQRRAIRIINDASITNALNCLQHRRDVADLSLFHRYYFGSCSLELKLQIPPPKITNRVTRSSLKSHPYVVEETVCRTTHFQNDFFTRTASKWNKLPAYLFPPFNTGSFKSALHRYLLEHPIPRLSSIQQ